MDFQHEVTEEILRKSGRDWNTWTSICKRFQFTKAIPYFVPAGTVHGIGKGTLVAEIQESSNVTYRVYDYDRVDKTKKNVSCTLTKLCRS